MMVTSEPGHYFFKSSGEDATVCGVYIMTDPDKLVQIQFEYLDMPCASGGLVAVSTNIIFFIRYLSNKKNIYIL